MTLKKEFILKPKKNSSEIIPLHYSGDVTQKLDIAIIADGYTKKDIEKMKKDFENFKDYILKSKPFDKNTDKINIWGIAAISTESGITNPIDTFVAKNHNRYKL